MKKRKDSFWGIHSDYHAKPEMGMVGKTLREEDIRAICKLLKPDYWQIDCKGHPGWASYPTKLGNAMPEFAFDTLEMWRRVTREEDVALFLHYSGVIDAKYCAEHPEECVMHADGTLDDQHTRRGGKYADELLIPQLSEAAEHYGVDGFWIDGDCWGSRIDYHPDTLAAFEKETGIDLNGSLPAKKGDPYFEEYRRYNRELFRRYVRHYVDVLHQKHPDLQITSNWMFSDHMPEAVTANVDFLSGDLNPWNAFNWARYAGRAMAQQNHPWDLMAWTHRSATPGHLDALPVHVTQLIQEAAAVISLGGGFQQVIGQLMDGAPDVPYLKQLKPLSDFMRQREPYCFRAAPVHQAAMLLSTHDRHLEGNDLFSRGNCDGKLGLTALLCDAGQSLEIVSEHTLHGSCAKYPLLIVPEILEGLAPETIQELLDYAQNGGNLMLVGTKTCRIFADAGAPFTVSKVQDDVLEVSRICHVNDADAQRFFTLDDTAYGCVFDPVQINAQNGDILASTCYTIRGEHHPYAVVIPYGKGRIAAIGSDLGTHYLNEAQYLHRTLIRTVTDALYTPIVRVEQSLGTLEVVCTTKEDQFLVQLINANGNHTNMNCATEDKIPPVVDIRLSLALPEAPKQLILQPEGRELLFRSHDGRIYVDIDRIDMHNVLEIVF